LNMLAMQLRTDPTAELSSYFNQNLINQLKTLALTAEIPQDRMAAVTALKRVGDADSQAALLDISQRSTDKRVLDVTRPKLVKGR
jgi:hypothetical protein